MCGVFSSLPFLFLTPNTHTHTHTTTKGGTQLRLGKFGGHQEHNSGCVSVWSEKKKKARLSHPISSFSSPFSFSLSLSVCVCVCVCVCCVCVCVCVWQVSSQKKL